MSKTLQAPFPWFGGKSRVAHVVWERFGDVPNYVEPFFGSGAVLLGRPHEGQRTETINDKDGFVTNFWRAVKADAEGVAYYAVDLQSENDLHARHAWLVNRRAALVPKLEGDPEYYDAKIAGWWCWGVCLWIRSAFCIGGGAWQVVDGQLVHLGDKGRGVKRQRVHLGDKGRGVNRQRVHLSRGQGVNRKRVHLGDKGQGVRDWFVALSERLSMVRVCSGDWSRVCGPLPTFKHGLTGVFLDPPYADTAERTGDLYAEDCNRVAHDVRAWAVEQGENPLMRIALCGYEGEHEMPDSWAVYSWKSSGNNYSKKHRSENAARERIWFSPHCLNPTRGRQLEIWELCQNALDIDDV